MGRDEGLRAVDRAFERLFADGTIPGMAYGVVIAGDLVHARGLGTLHHGEDRAPGCRQRLPHRVDDQELHGLGGAAAP